MRRDERESGRAQDAQLRPHDRPRDRARAAATRCCTARRSRSAWCYESALAERLGVARAGHGGAHSRRPCGAPGCPTRVPPRSTSTTIVDATRGDKKARAGRVEYALPARIGAMAGASRGWSIAGDDDAGARGARVSAASPRLRTSCSVRRLVACSRRCQPLRDIRRSSSMSRSSARRGVVRGRDAYLVEVAADGPLRRSAAGRIVVGDSLAIGCVGDARDPRRFRCAYVELYVGEYSDAPRRRHGADRARASTSGRRTAARRAFGSARHGGAVAEPTSTCGARRAIRVGSTFALRRRPQRRVGHVFIRDVPHRLHHPDRRSGARRLSAERAAMWIGVGVIVLIGIGVLSATSARRCAIRRRHRVRRATDG